MSTNNGQVTLDKSTKQWPGHTRNVYKQWPGHTRYLYKKWPGHTRYLYKTMARSH